MTRSFYDMIAEARRHYAAVVDVARRPDASREEIAAALDLNIARRLARRGLELARLPLSQVERAAALAAFSDQLERERAADLAALLDEH